MPKWLKNLLTFAAIVLILAVLIWYTRNYKGNEKPVIYLYPESETEVTVSLELNGELTTTYPLGERSDGASALPAKRGFVLSAPDSSDALGPGGNGKAEPAGDSTVTWQVTARPDGTLTDAAGNTYSYLYWEGESRAAYDLSHGFVVKGEDSADFLREKLSYLGLTPREYNEFIVYWLPRLEKNTYNLITFQGEAYTDSAKLTITPEPDSLLRVFMVFKPLARLIDVPEQELTPFARKGFTVIEWGGCELK